MAEHMNTVAIDPERARREDPRLNEKEICKEFAREKAM